nr:hypothetical protein 5 [bacterium]
MSVNDELRDIAVTHQHYLERYKSHEVNKVQALMGDATTKIKGELMKADITKWAKNRYEKMLEKLEGIQKTANEKYEQLFLDDMKEFVKQEGKFYARTLDVVLKPLVNLETHVPSSVHLWAIAKTDPLMLDDGTTISFRKYVKRLSSARVDAIRQTMRQGFVLGKSSVQIARELARNGSLLNRSRNLAEMIVRTAANHVSSEARKGTQEVNSDIVKGYEWVSTLDARTTPICQYRDGLVWYDDEKQGERSTNLLPGEVRPPAHYRCRSTITFITKSWRELGFDVDEVPDSARAALDGTAPERITYREWLRKQPAAIQKEVLGVTRYNMLREGKITVNEFYSRDGRLLTLKQLGDKSYRIKSFVPVFKSIEEAQQWAERHLANIVELPGINLKTFQKINEETRIAFDRYKIDKVGNLKWRKQRDGSAGALVENLSTGELGLEFRKTHFLNPKKYQKRWDEIFEKNQELRINRIQRQIEIAEADKRIDLLTGKPLAEKRRQQLKEAKAIKRYITGTEGDLIKSTIEHEVTHAFDKLNILAQHPRATATTEQLLGRHKWDEMLEKYKVAKIDELRVSEYAASTRTELFAEVGVFYLENNLKAIPQSVAKAFLETIKGVI